MRIYLIMPILEILIYKHLNNLLLNLAKYLFFHKKIQTFRYQKEIRGYLKRAHVLLGNQIKNKYKSPIILKVKNRRKKKNQKA
jgi:hypothetical protein